MSKTRALSNSGTQIFTIRSSRSSSTSMSPKPEIASYLFSGRGTIYSYTTVYDPPEGFAGPYTVALVRLDEGPLVTAQITDDPDHTARIGTPVEMVTRKLREDGERGVIVYGYKFRPVIQSR